MSTITVIYTYKLTYAITGHTDYCFASDKNLYNLKRNKLVKKCYNGSIVGYYLNSKFYSLKQIKQLLIKYKPDTICPF